MAEAGPSNSELSAFYTGVSRAATPLMPVPSGPLFDSVDIEIPDLGVDMALVSPALGTYMRSEWILQPVIATSVLSAVPRRNAAEFIRSSSTFTYIADASLSRVIGISVSLATLPMDDTSDRLKDPGPSDVQIAARHLREISGLTAAQIGELLDITRESFSRYLSGAIVPTAENEQRIYFMSAFVADVAHRVTNVKSWLLTPATEDLESPYELLRAGHFEAAKTLAIALPTLSEAIE